MYIQNTEIALREAYEIKGFVTCLDPRGGRRGSHAGGHVGGASCRGHAGGLNQASRELREGEGDGGKEGAPVGKDLY